jgi:hypothetical protein
MFAFFLKNLPHGHSFLAEEIDVKLFDITLLSSLSSSLPYSLLRL